MKNSLIISWEILLLSTRCVIHHCGSQDKDEIVIDNSTNDNDLCFTFRSEDCFEIIQFRIFKYLDYILKKFDGKRKRNINLCNGESAGKNISTVCYILFELALLRTVEEQGQECKNYMQLWFRVTDSSIIASRNRSGLSMFSTKSKQLYYRTLANLFNLVIGDCKRLLTLTYSSDLAADYTSKRVKSRKSHQSSDDSDSSANFEIVQKRNHHKGVSKIDVEIHNFFYLYAILIIPSNMLNRGMFDINMIDLSEYQREFVKSLEEALILLELLQKRFKVILKKVYLYF